MPDSCTVQSGDTLGQIALKKYGVSGRYTDIIAANPQLAGRKTASDGSPLIFPGDVLILPEQTDIPADVESATPVVISPEASREMSLYLDGKLFTGFTGYTLQFNIDTMDAFSFSAPWLEDNEELKKAFEPFAYKKCAVYYRNQLMFTGTLLTPAPSVTPDNRTINPQGYPLCGVLSDCTIPDTKYPLCYRNLTLEQIAKDILQPFGLQAVFDSSSGAPFEKAESEPGEKVLDFLKKLAGQRGLLFTNTEEGMLRFWQKTGTGLNATFKQGEWPFIEAKCEFKPQEMYSHVTGFSKTDNESNAEKYTYVNSFLTKKGVFRPYSFVAELSDAKANDIEEATKAKAAAMFANAVSYKLSVYGHTDKDGNIFNKDMTVSVYAPAAMIFRETKFLVDSIEFKKSDTQGEITTFKLTLPGSRDNSLPEVLPWEE